ncbi:hypothetical protein C1645_834863 [Glomus cerebriforme]|uniref:Uncharacterized protein n=1 Tax=Glomus cerebriforme TaxID=658196 RepID=A0A397SFK3_9GLOM|nr:hypothetical protein C1645_834863 [Glomus cerebriforme]
MFNKQTQILPIHILFGVLAERKRRNAETLRSNEEYNERCDAKNVKLKARIKELEKNKADSLVKNIRHDDEVAELKAKLRDEISLRNNKIESSTKTIFLEND